MFFVISLPIYHFFAAAAAAATLLRFCTTCNQFFSMQTVNGENGLVCSFFKFRLVIFRRTFFYAIVIFLPLSLAHYHSVFVLCTAAVCMLLLYVFMVLSMAHAYVHRAYVYALFLSNAWVFVLFFVHTHTPLDKRVVYIVHIHMGACKHTHAIMCLCTLRMVEKTKQ